MGNQNNLGAKAQAALEQKKAKQKSILIGVCIVLVAVLMIGVIVYKNLAESGFLLRREVAAQSENFEVDGSMMAYYFNNQYQTYYSYASYLGIDTSKPLKSQASVYGGTWFDYFMDLTVDYVTEMLALCEAAKAANVTLDEEDMATIESSISELELYAKYYGYSLDQYIAANFGAGIKEKDLRNAMELANLASKYSIEYQDSLSYDKDACEAYYAGHVDAFDTVDLLKLTIERADYLETDEEGNVVGDVTAAAESAALLATQLSEAASVEEFKTIAKDYMLNVLGEDEEKLDTLADALLEEGVVKTTGAHSTEVMEWLFSAKTGDTNIFAETEKDSDVRTVFHVYYVVREAGRDETLTRDIRQILFSFDQYEAEEMAQIEAEAIYAEWEEGGFTAELFSELNKTYNDDPGSVDNDGLYEMVAPGDMVDEFNDWLFDSERAAGDTGLVETEYGWHIMYYVGENEVPVWQVNAEASLTQEAFQAHVDENSTSITFDNAVLGHIAA